MNYYDQWSHEELMSWHGLEPEDLIDDDTWDDLIDVDDIELPNLCPMCKGTGCKYCLMTEY